MPGSDRSSLVRRHRRCEGCALAAELALHPSPPLRLFAWDPARMRPFRSRTPLLRTARPSRRATGTEAARSASRVRCTCMHVICRIDPKGSRPMGVASSGTPVRRSAGSSDGVGERDRGVRFWWYASRRRYGEGGRASSAASAHHTQSRYRRTSEDLSEPSPPRHTSARPHTTANHGAALRACR